MTDLNWLYDAIEGRTKHDLARIHWQNIAQDAGDEIAAVLRAAEDVAKIHTFDTHMILKKTLAALTAKGGEK